MSASSLFADRRDARNNVITFLSTMMNAGYSEKGYTIDYLSEGRKDSYSVTLYRGNDYIIAGVGDGGIRDLDVYLYDEEGTLLMKDTKAKNLTALKFHVNSTETYIVKVKAYKGSGYYSLVIGYK